jgi:hypothetical protein
MRNFINFSVLQVKQDEMGRACSTNWAKSNVYRIVVGKPEGRGH